MPKSRRTLMLVGLCGSVLFLLAYFWLLARHRPEINFLSSHSPAQWIVFPEVPAGSKRNSVDVTATFRRTFVLNEIPKTTQLFVRAMRHWEITLNGSPLPDNGADDRWKEETLLDVAAQLHTGTNEIVVTVSNTNGPAALWLALQMDGQQLISDSSWRVQLFDSVECNARLATQPPPLNPGNRMRVTETPLEGFRRNWPFFIFAAVVSAILLSLVERLRKRHGEFFASDNFVLCAIALPALLWTVLFFHNLPSLTYQDGFDSEDHLRYIERVLTKPGLPLASEGWQMYQPPLYYVVSATVLDLTAPATVTGKVAVVRTLSMGIGIVHLILIFLSLRLIFPSRPRLQLFGLLLATFLPAHLYISQFTSNEGLAAMLVTASIFICLKIVVEKRESWGIFAALGVTFGAALLAKVTAILAAPFIAAALIDFSVLRNPPRLKIWLSNIGASAAMCIAVCGWHYYRVWSHFGTPLAGNWTPSVWPAWWMEPGFRTFGYFFRFGACLIHPWFSGYNGFADGLYSTLWGDALFGGQVAFEHHPCWNYELMAAGFLLALVPSCFILAGLFGALKKLIREPGPIWLLIVGFPLGVLAALVYMNLTIPTYGEAKAFYGLVALLPVCALGALGYDATKRLGKPVLWAGTFLFGIWAMNSYATFWTKTDSADAQIRLGLGTPRDGHDTDALQHYSEAVRMDPRSVKAKAFLAIEQSFQGHTNEVHALAVEAAKEPLPDGASHFYLAEIYGLDHQDDAAVAEARKAIETDADNPLCYDALCSWLCRPGHYAEAISIGREGERVSPFSGTLQFNLGCAFVGVGDQTNAAAHFHLASILIPDWPETYDKLGISLMALGRYTEATNQYSKALRLRWDPNFQYHLALAFAEMGDTSREVEQYREILRADAKFVPALESLAWRLATNPDAAQRNGTEAVQLASIAYRLKGTNDAQFPCTLAAAYASTGQFEEAAQAARQAVEIAERAKQTNAATQAQKMLKLFQSGELYIDQNPRTPVIPPDWGEK